MEVKILTATVAALVIAASSVARAEDAPGIATNIVRWTQEDVVKYKLTQDGCHNYAVDTLSRAHAEDLDTQARSVFATIYHDGIAYSAAIRCEVDNKIAFMVVTGKNEGLEAVSTKLGEAWSNNSSPRQAKRTLKKKSDERVD